VLLRASLPGGYRLLVGRDVARFLPLERRFWYGLAGAVAVLCIVGVLGGFLIRRTLLSRIDSIRRTVHAIMQGDLSHRLPGPQSGDELDTLSQTRSSSSSMASVTSRMPSRTTCARRSPNCARGSKS
jgi:hypothetical protein